MIRRRANGMAAGFVLAAALAWAACTGVGRGGSMAPLEPGQFGERSGDAALVFVSPPDSTLEYTVQPAVFDTVHVRPEAIPAGPDGTRIEVLVKGSFPDACTELHAVEQQRSGSNVTMSLSMRRPVGRLCASVMRPYRFYVELNGRYDAGTYTLTLNELNRPFTVN